MPLNVKDKFYFGKELKDGDGGFMDTGWPAEEVWLRHIPAGVAVGIYDDKELKGVMVLLDARPSTIRKLSGVEERL